MNEESFDAKLGVDIGIVQGGTMPKVQVTPNPLGIEARSPEAGLPIGARSRRSLLEPRDSVVPRAVSGLEIALTFPEALSLLPCQAGFNEGPLDCLIKDVGASAFQ